MTQLSHILDLVIAGNLAGHVSHRNSYGATASVIRVSSQRNQDLKRFQDGVFKNNNRLSLMYVLVYVCVFSCILRCL